MKIIFSIFFLALTVSGISQGTVEKVNQSRQKTIQEIEYANKLLQETKGKTKESLNEINVINHKLTKRKEYLIGLEVEVNLISGSIEKNQQQIYEIEKEIEGIRDVYAKMIVSLYKNKVPAYMAMYLLASADFNQLYKRIYTVKLYNSYLKNQKSRLDALKSELEQKNAELAKLKSNKDIVVNKTKSETSRIQKEISEKNQIVKQLKQKQSEIEADIKEKEKTARKLENELKKLIEEERRKARAKTVNKENFTPEDKLISNDFEKNTGKLPWPTQKGIITGKYGEHQHPDYKYVTVRNDGIYIATTQGESARAIFKGTVSRVFQIPGQNYTVIIKHGKYYSLYHNLVNVKVKPGQNLETKQIIGTVSTDSNTKETVLYFQIWKDNERNDPELWLAPL
jgi:septal ring factor EnvC (AmiA/AmiB activator)